MGSARHLRTVPAACCLCGPGSSDPVGRGEDFEYRVSGDTWHAHRCRGCGLVFLNPRPADDELDTIYPPTYHAFAFTGEQYGFVHRVRRRLEARRLLRVFGGLSANARILDVGCGDGFHLGLLREFGPPGWMLDGVDVSQRAVERATAAGLTVHHGTVADAPLPATAYDGALLIQTLEHLGDPAGTLAAIRDKLKPGGRLYVVTDNARSLDARLFGRRHWGGYHFPRHWYLFDKRTLPRLAERAGLRAVWVRTIVSPVNWVYSIRNRLVDRGAPGWLVERFSLKTPVSLGVFTLLDSVLRLAGHGALLQGVFERSEAI